MKTNEVLFDKFSKNLQNICKTLKFELEDKFQNEAYICPLSFKIHTKDGLSNEYEDQLTIEHIPPESLNGKGLCLTNRILNSKAGHSLDLDMQNHIMLREFHEGVSSLKTKVYLDNVKMDVCIDFTVKDKPLFKFTYKSRHQGIERVEKKIISKEKVNLEMTLPKDNRNTSISFLRTAYLYAFANLGYSLLFGVTKLVNQNFNLIRKQINNPMDIIIKDIVLLNKNLDDLPLGLSIVYEPKEFRSLLVVLEIKTDIKNWRYAMFLPGPDDYGFTAINNIKTHFSKHERINFQYSTLSKIDITDSNESNQYYKRWEKLNDFYRE